MRLAGSSEPRSSSQPATLAVEPFVNAGYPTDAAGILLCESDGTPEEVEEEIARIEREHAADLAAFDERQREKYDELRESGPEAVSSFLADFNRRFRDAGL